MTYLLVIIRLPVYNIRYITRKDGQFMKYISATEAAKKWGISERRVQKLCAESRIPGVTRFSRMWLIPKDAEKPKDGRKKEEFR